MKAEVFVDAQRLCVKTPYIPEVKDALKALPGRWWEPERKIWTYPATATAAEAVVAVLREFGADIDLRNGAQDLAAQAEEVTAVGEQEEFDPVPGESLPSFHHQRRAFWRALASLKNSGGFYLAHEMGCGKTKIALDLARHLRCKRVLVIAPLAVVQAWPRQARVHGLQIPVHALDSGGAKTKAEKVAQANPPYVVAVNYESVWREPLAAWVLAQDWDLVICDEAHKIKEARTKVAKFAHKLAASTPRRLGLSGTPIANKPTDLFSQMRFVDAGVFGTSFLHFRDRYAIMGGYRSKQIVAFRNLDDLHERFYRVADRATKAEALDLPEFLDEELTVHLSRSAQAAYDELEETMTVKIKDGEITTSNALTSLLRLQQITGGCASLEDGRTETVDVAKQVALGDVLNGLPDHEPVVVFCRFRHDLRATHAAAEKAGRQCVEISGEAKELHLWEHADAEPSVIAVQIQSGGLGIDLTRAAYAVFYSLGFSLSDYDQARARLHRQGQTRAVTYLHLIARRARGEMIDEKVYRALSGKKKVVDAVIEGWND